jgi:cytochrome c oxidase assembly protein subunit 11
MSEQPEPIDERLPDTAARGRRMQRQLFVLLLLGGGMFGFAFANSRFFYRLCEAIGVVAARPEDVRGTISETADGRPLDVYFDAAVNDNLPLSFRAKESYQRIKQGGRAMNEYTFVNLSQKTIYFRPVHDIAPTEAGAKDILVLEKCFCFDEQKIEPGQQYTLPVVYSFGEKLSADVRVINMRYSLFWSTKERYEESQKSGAPKNPAHQAGGE